MVTIKKEGSIISTQEFILHKSSLTICLNLFCWKISKHTGEALISRAGRHNWCRQEAESLSCKEGCGPQALEEEETVVFRKRKCRSVHHLKGSVVQNSSMKQVFFLAWGHGVEMMSFGNDEVKLDAWFSCS